MTVTSLHYLSTRHIRPLTEFAQLGLPPFCSNGSAHHRTPGDEPSGPDRPPGYATPQGEGLACGRVAARVRAVMKIAFLIHNAYGIGGTIRATANLSGALAARGHQVEVVSAYRGVDTPHLPISGKVRITPLIDIRKDSPDRETDHELQQLPSALLPEPEGAQKVFTQLADQRIERYLAETDADVV